MKTILALGPTLKLSVVAERIETARQAQLLPSLGCALGAGYLFAKPLPVREIEDWLDAVSGIAVKEVA